MTAIAPPGSTTESRTAALAMFEGQVPCVFSLVDPSCPELARWLAWFVHEENTAVCDRDEPWLLCDGHKRILQASSHPFWRTWNRLQPLPCDACGTPLRVSRFDPL